MRQSLDAMTTALRVLTAITEKRHPDPGDVDVIRGLAGTGCESMGIDELACEVIQKALKRRASAGG